MKAIQFIFILCTAGILFSCDNEESNTLYQAYGVAILTPDGESNVKILTDDGNVLYPSKSLSISENTRLFTTFSLLDENDASRDTAVVEINSLDEILYKSIEEDDTDLGDDPVLVRTKYVWQSNFNQTVSIPFEFYGTGDTKHFINLLHNPEESNSDTIALEFRHNAYEELETKLFTGLVSFDLTSIEDLENVSVTDSIVYKITFNKGDASLGDTEYIGVYKALN